MKVIAPIFLQFSPNTCETTFDFSTVRIPFPVKFMRVVSVAYEAQNPFAGFGVIQS